MTAVTADLAPRVDAALEFLRREQRPNGEFPTYKARDAALVQDAQFDSTPFATTYVLHALTFVERPRVAEMAAAALDFLEAEMEPGGVWRYWPSQHPQHAFIPPDLDDTCCVTDVLRRWGRPVPANEELILANRNRAGLFYTWVVPHLRRTRSARGRSRAYWDVARRHHPVNHLRANFWRLTEAKPWDVDCVVNANVLLQLGERPEVAPVVAHLARALAEGRAASCDKWHLNAAAFHYAVARAYARGVSSLECLREPLAAAAGSALASADGLADAEVALNACALLNLEAGGAAVEEAVGRLASGQHADGSWPGFALYWGGPKNRTFGWGSDALTTGLCVEALARLVAPPASGVPTGHSASRG